MNSGETLKSNGLKKKFFIINSFTENFTLQILKEF